MSLIGYIGFGRSSSPASGVYIDDLPGLVAAKLEAFTNPDTGTANEVWEKIERRAVNGLLSEVRNALQQNDTFAIDSVFQTSEAGDYVTDSTTSTGSGDWEGVRLKVAYTGRYAELSIPYVRLYADTSVSTTVRVYDSTSGVQLYTQDFTLTEGHNTLRVEQTYSVTTGSREFFIAYNSTGVDGVRVWNINGDSYTTVTPARWDGTGTPVEGNLDLNVTPGTMVVNYYLKCSVEAFIEAHREEFKQALFYRLAVEMAIESLHNDEMISRYNWDRDRLAADFDRYSEAYQAELSAVLDTMRIEYDGICVTCNSPVKYKNNIP